MQFGFSINTIPALNKQLQGLRLSNIVAVANMLDQLVLDHRTH